MQLMGRGSAKIGGRAHSIWAFPDTWTGRGGHAHMNRQKQRVRSNAEPSRTRPREAMDEPRYQELIRNLNHLFLETEHNTQVLTAAQRQRVIEEIRALMHQHGVTIEDLGE